MTERLERQLGSDARQALKLAHRLAGRQPILKRVPSLPGEARGMLIRPRNPRRNYEIHFARGQERVLDHLVTHEIGHLVRLHQVPEDKRLIAVATDETRRRAAEQVATEILPLMAVGLPEQALSKVFSAWYEGVCTQLVSFPTDLRIEQWIHDRFPALRPVQRRSLMLEVDRNAPAFTPEVVALTPPTIYEATMAMNATQALHVAQLYDVGQDLLAQFALAGYGAKAKRLMELALDPADEGHRSDIVATNAWAEDVHTSGLIAWETPGGSLHANARVGIK